MSTLVNKDPGKVHATETMMLYCTFSRPMSLPIAVPQLPESLRQETTREPQEDADFHRYSFGISEFVGGDGACCHASGGSGFGGAAWGSIEIYK